MTTMAAAWDTVADAYREAIVDTGKQPELLLLVSFLPAFGLIRTSTHLIRAQVRWWPGNVAVSLLFPPAGVLPALVMRPRPRSVWTATTGRRVSA